MAQALLRPLPVPMRAWLQTSHRCLGGDGHTLPVWLSKRSGSLVSSSFIVTCKRTVDTSTSADALRSGAADYSGLVPAGTGKVRLDTWLAEQLPTVSRARVQDIIKQGHAVINGRPITKVSSTVKEGDHVQCRLPAPPPLTADPEDIPLDIVFEDEHLLVVNKPAHMVVHPAPGHSGGTLVNALLHHCGLPAMQYRSGSSSQAVGLCAADDALEGDSSLSDDDEIEGRGLFEALDGPPPVIRPGIVHRLDKGTSGLLVVAKDDYCHAQLCEQFKARSVSRTYVSLNCGVPTLTSGRIEISIGRDVRDRKRMAAILRPAGSSTARFAASRYRILEVLGQGGCALMEWKLETGRTHQIRVHAQHLGHPILGDEQYGGTSGALLSRLVPCLPSAEHGKARQLVSWLERPCLHAMTIGFTHPWTGLQHNFTRGPPQDFEDTWLALQRLGKHGKQDSVEVPSVPERLSMKH